jgi:hypothetical protein
LPAGAPVAGIPPAEPRLRSALAGTCGPYKREPAGPTGCWVRFAAPCRGRDAREDRGQRIGQTRSCRAQPIMATRVGRMGSFRTFLRRVGLGSFRQLPRGALGSFRSPSRVPSASFGRPQFRPQNPASAPLRREPAGPTGLRTRQTSPVRRPSGIPHPPTPRRSRRSPLTFNL